MHFSTTNLFAGFVVSFALAGVGLSAPEAGKSPLDELPPYIRQVTYFGERADWSHDGKRLLFLEKTFGDVYEVELATGIIRPMTNHYFHEGYTRALYLSNGDILLSGSRTFDASDPWPSRDEKKAELWVLKKDRSGPPTPLGEKCSEGPAVSRRNMRIAWTQGGAFYMADVVYDNGTPKLAGKKKVLDKKDLPFKCDVETQNFRPPEEKELTFSAYGYQGTEVMGLDLETGKVTNYSNAPGQYDEPEGIFPDGRHTLVECDKHILKGSQYDDHLQAGPRWLGQYRADHALQRLSGLQGLQPGGQRRRQVHRLSVCQGRRPRRRRPRPARPGPGRLRKSKNRRQALRRCACLRRI